MSKYPSLDQLPAYAEVIKALRRTSRQCIWYKPGVGDRCTIELSIEDLKLVFKWLRIARQATCPDRGLAALTRAVRGYCCDQYHRDMVQNSGLDRRLAGKWQSDIPKHASVVETGVEAVSTLSQLLEDLAIREDEAYFRPHKTLPSENVASRLLQRISKGKSEAHRTEASGYIYMFTQQVFQGMVKIGYTNSNVQKRIDYWSKCGHGQPNLVQSFPVVCHAKRIETLIHHELSLFWRRERYCKTHASAHMEWFEIETNEAVRVVDQWIAWMREAQPYDELGDLTQQWKSMIETLQFHKVSVTSKLLMDLHGLKEDDPYFTILEGKDR